MYKAFVLFGFFINVIAFGINLINFHVFRDANNIKKMQEALALLPINLICMMIIIISYCVYKRKKEDSCN